MVKERADQRGQALVELALVLPLLVILLLGIAEAGNMLNAYLTVVEASREGARLVVREGESADVKGMVETIMERLPTSQVAVRVRYGEDDAGERMVTVEVKYEYRFLFGALPLTPGDEPYLLPLRATTSMPLP